MNKIKDYFKDLTRMENPSKSELVHLIQFTVLLQKVCEKQALKSSSFKSLPRYIFWFPLMLTAAMTDPHPQFWKCTLKHLLSNSQNFFWSMHFAKMSETLVAQRHMAVTPLMMRLLHRMCHGCHVHNLGRKLMHVSVIT